MWCMFLICCCIRVTFYISLKILSCKTIFQKMCLICTSSQFAPTFNNYFYYNCPSIATFCQNIMFICLPFKDVKNIIQYCISESNCALYNCMWYTHRYPRNNIIKGKFIPKKQLILGKKVQKMSKF